MTYKKALEIVLGLANRWMDGEGAEEELTLPEHDEAIEMVEELKDNINSILG